MAVGTTGQQQHGDAYIINFMICMTRTTCGDVCRDMIHTTVEGVDHWSGEASGTLMPTGISAAVDSRDGEHKKEHISLTMDPIDMKLCRGM